MQDGDVRRQTFDVADGVYEGVVAVHAHLRAGGGDERHTTGCERLDTYEPKSLLDAREHEHIGLPHKVRHIPSVAEHADASMLESARQLLFVRRKEVAGDQECPVSTCRGLKPRFEREMQSLANRREAREQRSGARGSRGGKKVRSSKPYVCRISLLRGNL
jgi:hypothetical protein